jgi:conjugal transfer/type IV secretion protein DotA/TraY|tara:strand:+ start:12816 stop:16088 length:3273 start_codon:yes stop_codon:yes gene_type:complete
MAGFFKSLGRVTSNVTPWLGGYDRIVRNRIEASKALRQPIRDAGFFSLTPGKSRRESLEIRPKDLGLDFHQYLDRMDMTIGEADKQAFDLRRAGLFLWLLAITFAALTTIFVAKFNQGWDVAFFGFGIAVLTTISGSVKLLRSTSIRQRRFITMSEFLLGSLRRFLPVFMIAALVSGSVIAFPANAQDAGSAQPSSTPSIGSFAVGDATRNIDEKLQAQGFDTSIQHFAGTVFSVGQDDFTIGALSAIFGSLFQGAGGEYNGRTIISYVSGFASYTAGVIGMFWIGFMVLREIFDASQSGKVLDKRGAGWITMRWAAVSGVIFPVLGGYSIVQKLMAYVVIAGVGLANTAWGLVVDKAYFDRVPLVPVERPIPSDVMMAMVQNNLCAITMNSYYDVLYTDDRAEFEKHRVTVNLDEKIVEKGFLDKSWDFVKRSVQNVSVGTWDQENWVKPQQEMRKTISWDGAAEDSRFPRGICGKLTMSWDAANPEAGDYIRAAVLGAYLDLQNDGRFTDFARNLYGEHVQPGDYGWTNFSTTKVFAAREFNELRADVAGKIGAAISAALKANDARFGSAAPDDQAVSEAIRYGWFMAGVQILDIIGANSRFIEASQEEPDVSGPQFEIIDRLHSGDIAKAHFKSRVVTAFTTWRARVDPRMTPIYVGGASAEDKVRELIDEQEDPINQTIEGLAGALRSVSNFLLFGSNVDISSVGTAYVGDAFSAMSSLGTAMIGKGALLFGAGLGLEAASSMAGVATFGATKKLPVANFITEFVSKSAGALIFLGCLGIFFGLMVLLIPLSGAVYFLFAVISWITMVAEAILIAPIWTVAHLQASGDGPVSQGALKGYGVILNIFIRPFLILVAFIASLAIFAIMVPLCAKMAVGFSDVMFSNQVMSGLFSTLVFTLLAWVCAKTVWRFIPQLPENAERWISDLVGGGIAMGVDRDNARETYAGLAYISGGAQRQVDGAGAGIRKRISDGGEDRQAKMLQKVEERQARSEARDRGPQGEGLDGGNSPSGSSPPGGGGRGAPDSAGGNPSERATRAGSVAEQSMQNIRKDDPNRLSGNMPGDAQASARHKVHERTSDDDESWSGGV